MKAARRENLQAEETVSEEIYQVDIEEAAHSVGALKKTRFPESNRSLQLPMQFLPKPPHLFPKTKQNLNMNSAHSQRRGKGNFYTKASVQPTKKEPTEYELQRVLIDHGATLNLIVRKAVAQMKCNMFLDKSIIIKAANGDFPPRHVRTAFTGRRTA